MCQMCPLSTFNIVSIIFQNINIRQRKPGMRGSVMYTIRMVPKVPLSDFRLYFVVIVGRAPTTSQLIICRAHAHKQNIKRISSFVIPNPPTPYVLFSCVI